MSEFWSYIKSLFQQSKASSPSKPLVHELIQRSQEEQEDYRRWKETLVFQRLKDWLSNQYALSRHLPDELDEALDFLDTPSSKGFVVHFHKTGYSTREAVHFLDYLKDAVLAEDYRIQISDLRVYERPKWVETVQRHYLKPRPAMNEARKLRQRFGNVTVELYLRDDKPYQLRFRATSYRDHLFQEAEPFDILVQSLFFGPA